MNMSSEEIIMQKIARIVLFFTFLMLIFLTGYYVGTLRGRELEREDILQRMEQVDSIKKLTNNEL